MVVYNAKRNDELYRLSKACTQAAQLINTAGDALEDVRESLNRLARAYQENGDYNYGWDSAEMEASRKVQEVIEKLFQEKAESIYKTIESIQQDIEDASQPVDELQSRYR